MGSFIKLEGTYLKILRYAILFLATIVLIVSFLTTAIGFSNLGFFKLPSNEVPTVKSEEVLKNMTISSRENAPSVVPSTSQITGNTSDLSDPNQPYYDRCVKAAGDFIAAYSTDVIASDAMERFKSQAEHYQEVNTVASFASGLADTLEKVLSDKSVINRASKESAGTIIGQVIMSYKTKFDQELARINTDKASKEAEVAMKRTSGIMLLSVAGGSFLAFLLLTFLIIFVKIELNLREIATKS
jgi:hypothetical protein